ncbi:helix-turn-helix domain-containing protein [Romboutsia sedimentorum]|uniref:Helix-turn-helix domain-containing protein n=1 Tax=Romboutsia sedimentorum TaxID=1368474 RepID=A0ABT7E9T2_9FIRM|nr:helix-turn-helix domain-containing protein [Romboutsia sedimentorum]MDK2563679.1 helix-turn-helix domain-containing protein [Romboutsia sedimentorum]
MKYINAADVLPKELLDEILNYVDGELLYIPISGNKQKWGENSGSREYYKKRNTEIINLYKNGVSIIDIAQNYYLSYDSVRKIVRK